MTAGRLAGGGPNSEHCGVLVVKGVAVDPTQDVVDPTAASARLLESLCWACLLFSSILCICSEESPPSGFPAISPEVVCYNTVQCSTWVLLGQGFKSLTVKVQRLLYTTAHAHKITAGIHLFLYCLSEMLGLFHQLVRYYITVIIPPAVLLPSVSRKNVESLAKLMRMLEQVIIIIQ